MKKKSSPPSLQALFTEGPLARLLKEEDDSPAHETGASGDSLDAQVDRHFGNYESASRKVEGEDMGASVEQMESLDWRDLVKGRLITEAGEDEEPAAGEEDAAAEMPPADPMAGAGGDDAGKLGLESLNVEAFANDVARLIESYDSLLEIRSTLLRRASTFLKKTYKDEVVDAFEDSMRDDHGMEAGSSPQDIEAEKFKAPNADRAAGSAEPGVGGGGAPA